MVSLSPSGKCCGDCEWLGVDISGNLPSPTTILTTTDSQLQRKFLGWGKSKPPPPPTHSDPPTPDSNPNSPIIQLGGNPEKDPSPHRPQNKQSPTPIGLGLGHPTQQDDNSRLVHFEPNPTIRPQPSLESTQALGCFPPSKSTSPTSPTQTSPPSSAQPKLTQSRSVSNSTTRNSPRPSDSPPAPLVNASVRTGASPYAASAQSRTTSPLSFSHPSGGALGQSPYGYGSAHPSLARLSERDPDQIHQPITWSELANPDLVDNVSARERVRQEIL